MSRRAHASRSSGDILNMADIQETTTPSSGRPSADLGGRGGVVEKALEMK